MVVMKKESHSKSTSKLLNLHAVLPRSQANGPGVRTTIWLQGCTRACVGCFNPETHSYVSKQLITPEQLWSQTRTIDGIEGITVSGGEPLLQAKALSGFLSLLRTESRLSVVLYTGYLLEEIKKLPNGIAVIDLVDVLIDGPYNRSKPAKDSMRGSENQRIHFLTTRYKADSFKSSYNFEIMICSDGTVINTGVSVPRLSCTYD